MDMIKINLINSDQINPEEASLFMMGNYGFDTEKEISKIDLKKTIRAVLETLSEREKYVLIKRSGLYDDNDYTLAEIGKQLGVSGQMIRIIEAKALRKLRHPSRAKNLYLFCKREFLLEKLEKMEKEHQRKAGDRHGT
jgi:RNA polymerase sigma factor (sigma-70 family)